MTATAFVAEQFRQRVLLAAEVLQGERLDFAAQGCSASMCRHDGFAQAKATATNEPSTTHEQLTHRCPLLVTLRGALLTASVFDPQDRPDEPAAGPNRFFRADRELPNGRSSTKPPTQQTHSCDFVDRRYSTRSIGSQQSGVTQLSQFLGRGGRPSLPPVGGIRPGPRPCCRTRGECLAEGRRRGKSLVRILTQAAYEDSFEIGRHISDELREGVLPGRGHGQSLPPSDVPPGKADDRYKKIAYCAE